MDAFASVARRALGSLAILLLIAGCGNITLAPDADGAASDAGLLGGSGGTGSAGSAGAGGQTATGGAGTGGLGGAGGTTGFGGPAGAGGGAGSPGCGSDDDCHQGKAKRCDLGTGLCVACLGVNDCDGDRTCAGEKCVGGAGED